MNTRERFLAVMNFEKVDRTLFWEMGYWKDTLERWYQEGLPRKKDVTLGLKPGEGIRAENSPHEELIARERRRDEDVHNALGFDKGMVCLPINSLVYPQFEKKVFEETEDSILFQDEFGVKKRMNEPTPRAKARGFRSAGIPVMTFGHARLCRKRDSAPPGST